MTAEYLKLVSQNVHAEDLFAGVYLLPPRQQKGEVVCQELVRYLREDCRMTLTAISRATRIPVSTLHDQLKKLRRHYHLRLTLEPKDGERR